MDKLSISIKFWSYNVASYPVPPLLLPAWCMITYYPYLLWQSNLHGHLTYRDSPGQVGQRKRGPGTQSRVITPIMSLMFRSYRGSQSEDWTESHTKLLNSYFISWFIILQLIWKPVIGRACSALVSQDLIVGPSGVRELPLAAGINVGGHYK